jgi:hypothetical protein
MEAANRVFNPRNAMHISRNDGMMNNQFNHRKDTMILLNVFLSMCNDKYSQKDNMLFEACKAYRDENYVDV